MRSLCWFFAGMWAFAWLLGDGLGIDPQWPLALLPQIAFMLGVGLVALTVVWVLRWWSAGLPFYGKYGLVPPRRAWSLLLSHPRMTRRAFRDPGNENWSDIVDHVEFGEPELP